MKKILILGAGIYQVPLIKEAKAQGHYVIVTSIEGNYPGFDLADKIYYENTTDKMKILEIAKNEAIDAICTTGTDVAMETIGYVSEMLGLYGISEKTAILSTNKAVMKDAFIKNNVRTAKYSVISNKNDLALANEEFTKPVILKIVDSSGSRGIIKIENESMLFDSFDLLMDTTKKDYIIIEEYITGEEFGAQALISNSKVEFIMPHGDILFHGKTDVPIGHFVPYHLNAIVYKDLVVQIENAIKALEIKDCVINADFILSDNKIYVLEIGARAGATNLPELTSIYLSINYYKYILDLALGTHKPYVDSKHHQACSSMLLYSQTSGLIHSIKDNNKNIDYYEFELDYDIGDKIKEFEVGPDRIGHIVMKTSKTTTKDIVDEINTIANNVEIRIDEKKYI